MWGISRRGARAGKRAGGEPPRASIWVGRVRQGAPAGKWAGAYILRAVSIAGDFSTVAPE